MLPERLCPSSPAESLHLPVLAALPPQQLLRWAWLATFKNLLPVSRAAPESRAEEEKGSEAAWALNASSERQHCAALASGWDGGLGPDRGAGS